MIDKDKVIEAASAAFKDTTFSNTSILTVKYGMDWLHVNTKNNTTQECAPERIDYFRNCAIELFKRLHGFTHREATEYFDEMQVVVFNDHDGIVSWEATGEDVDDPDHDPTWSHYRFKV